MGAGRGRRARSQWKCSGGKDTGWRGKIIIKHSGCKRRHLPHRENVIHRSISAEILSWDWGARKERGLCGGGDDRGRGIWWSTCKNERKSTTFTCQLQTSTLHPKVFGFYLLFFSFFSFFFFFLQMKMAVHSDIKQTRDIWSHFLTIFFEKEY